MTPVAKIQHWFGGEIRKPLGSPISERANLFIAPSATLKPKERLVLYQQQYWWRLLSTLQSNFPMVTRLFGYDAFNTQIAIPYLSACPPSHWALCHLGDTLPQWVLEHYIGEDRSLVVIAAAIDWAAQEAFWIGDLPPIDFASLSEEERLTLPLTLQPHIHLFALEGDLLTFRDAFLEEDVEHWSVHPFPEMDYRSCYVAIFRDPNNYVKWRELSVGEYTMLTYFVEGATIEEACARIARTAPQEAAELLPLWFQSWISLNWFTTKSEN